MAQAAVHPGSRDISRSRGDGTFHASLSGMVTLPEQDTHPPTFRQDTAGTQADLFQVACCGGQGFAIAASKAVAGQCQAQLQYEWVSRAREQASDQASDQADVPGLAGKKASAGASTGAGGAEANPDHPPIRMSLCGSAMAPFAVRGNGGSPSGMSSPAPMASPGGQQRQAQFRGVASSSTQCGCFVHAAMRVGSAAPELTWKQQHELQQANKSEDVAPAGGTTGAPAKSGPGKPFLGIGSAHRSGPSDQGDLSVDLWLVPVPIPAPASQNGSPMGTAGSIAVEYVAHVTSATRQLASSGLHAVQQCVQAASLALIKEAMLLSAWEAGVLLLPSPEFWPRLIGVEASASEIDSYLVRNLNTMLATPPPAGGTARGHGTVVHRSQAQAAMELALGTDGSGDGETGPAADPRGDTSRPAIASPSGVRSSSGRDSGTPHSRQGSQEGSPVHGRGGGPYGVHDEEEHDGGDLLSAQEGARRSLSRLRRLLDPQSGVYGAGRSILLLASLAAKQKGRRELETPLRALCATLRLRSRLHAGAQPAVQQLAVLLRLAASTSLVSVRAGLATNAALRACGPNWVGARTATEYPLRPSIVVLLVHARQRDRALLGICCTDIPSGGRAGGASGAAAAGAAHGGSMQGTTPVAPLPPPDLRLFSLAAPGWSLLRGGSAGESGGGLTGDWWSAPLRMLVPREQAASILGSSGGTAAGGAGRGEDSKGGGDGGAHEAPQDVARA